MGHTDGKGKPECCQKFVRKSKACKDCPVMATLSKKERKRLIKIYRKLRKVGQVA